MNTPVLYGVNVLLLNKENEVEIVVAVYTFPMFVAFDLNSATMPVRSMMFLVCLVNEVFA